MWDKGATMECLAFKQLLYHFYPKPQLKCLNSSELPLLTIGADAALIILILVHAGYWKAAVPAAEAGPSVIVLLPGFGDKDVRRTAMLAGETVEGTVDFFSTVTLR